VRESPKLFVVLNRLPRRGRRSGVAVDPQAVRQARAEAGLSLAQVADGKVSRTAIHLIEAGKTRPSLETLQLIAAKTGKSMAYFVAPPPPDLRGRRISDLESALLRNDMSRVLELGARLLEEGVDEATEASARYIVGRAHLRRGEGRAALDHLEIAGRIFKNHDDPWKSVECSDQTACAYFLLDDPRSLPLAEEALRRCRDLKPLPSDLESRILGNLAIMHVHARRWSQAIYFYEECLKAGDAVRDLRHRALVYDGLSVAYQRLGNVGEATSYAHKAIALYSLESDVAAIALAENNLGDILMRSGRLEDAERHVSSGLKLCLDNGLGQSARIYALLTLGEIHLMQQQPDAPEILQRVISDGEVEDQRVAVACAHQLLGRLAVSENNVQEAIREFETALGLIEKLNMSERMRDCLVEYATFLDSAGEPASHFWKRAALVGVDLARPSRPFGTYLAEGESAG
jgi:tetratricopeptide (TPR) repeat protein/DNA-binding XRE family transcriptional regulator